MRGRDKEVDKDGILGQHETGLLFCYSPRAVEDRDAWRIIVYRDNRLYFNHDVVIKEKGRILFYCCSGK